MKITDPEIIQTGEKKIIAEVQKHLDLAAVKKILTDRMVDSSVVSRGGQIVVHDNQIAFRLDFDLKLSGSLLFDRQGNVISDPAASDETLSAPCESAQKNMPDMDDADDDLDGDDISDDDIDDILKESREFWEQKKDA